MLSASRARGALRPVLGRSSALQQQVRHCGLVATLQRRKTQPFDRCETGVIGTACERLHHRGPDGSGQLLGRWGSDGSQWALGHTRLAIVAPDETSANQPFSLGTTPSCVADVSMVANGEIYAHKAIFDTLVAEHGYPFDARRSGSDCEVIAHAYRALGSVGALRALESAGMFAFVLIDHRADAADGALVAARDPTGIKPLYYGVDETGTPVGDPLLARLLKPPNLAPSWLRRVRASRPPPLAADGRLPSMHSVRVGAQGAGGRGARPGAHPRVPVTPAKFNLPAPARCTVFESVPAPSARLTLTLTLTLALALALALTPCPIP